MCDIGGCATFDEGLVKACQLDPAEVLGFAASGLQELVHRDRLPESSRSVLAGQNQERFCVASHAGCEMVELKEALEGFGICLVALHRGDVFELARQQVLVASAEVDEGR